MQLDRTVEVTEIAMKPALSVDEPSFEKWFSVSLALLRDLSSTSNASPYFRFS